MTDDLRQPYAAAILARLRQSAPTPSEYDLADAVISVRDEEVKRLRYELVQWHAAYGEKALPATLARLHAAEAKVRDYENAITWDTTCLRHSALLDECRQQEERAEQAEAALASARNLCARSPLCVPAGQPGEPT